jgi:uncharacterized tellurite resistance protein B-like protein
VTIGIGDLNLRRAILFYLIYFLIFLYVDATFLQGLPFVVQLGITFSVPWLVVGWHHKRVSKRPKSNQTRRLKTEATAKPGVGQFEHGNRRGQDIVANEARNFDPQQHRNTLETAKSAPESQSIPSKLDRTFGKNLNGGWIPKGHSGTVAGRKIGDMVYVGSPPRVSLQGYSQKLKAYIDPSLSVAQNGSDKQGTGMPYWPSYSEIPSVCRATYLDWLASGRSDATVNPGYMFLYFYGLERRFLVDDSPDQEKQDILDEVIRLMSLFKENHSAQRYLGAFADLARIILGHSDTRKPILKNWGWEMPLSLKFAIGQMAANDQPLTADWTLSWLICHPERRLRTPAQRCEREFFKLYSLKFAKRFPDGLKLPKPKRHLVLSYRAASGEFEENLPLFTNDQPIPDISSLRKPIEIAQAIADEAMAELEKFSRFLGRKPEGRGSLEGHALLPLELRDHIPSAELNKLKDWVASLASNGGSIRCEDLIARLEGTKTEKASKKQMADAADTLGRIGFGIAPDARFSIRSAKPNEALYVFELANTEEHLEGASESYKSAMLEVALAALVIHADSRVDQTEIVFLRKKVSEFRGLIANEQRQLMANLEWYLAVPPNLGNMRGLLENAPAQQHQSLRQAIVAAARADGVLQSEEVESIGKIYKILGIDPRQAYSDIHAGQVADGPITVKPYEPGAPGEIVPNRQHDSAISLRSERIEEIRTDTARVSEILGNIFSEPDGALTPTPVQDDVEQILEGLDRKYVPVLQRIIEKNHWPQSEFQELMVGYGLMVAGALETLNEWSYQRFDEALLDEYDGYGVSPNIASTLRAELVERVLQ